MQQQNWTAKDRFTVIKVKLVVAPPGHKLHLLLPHCHGRDFAFHRLIFGVLPLRTSQQFVREYIFILSLLTNYIAQQNFVFLCGRLIL